MHFIQLPCEDIDKFSRLSKEKHCSCLLPVYIALIYHADKKGKCFPGYARIKEISGVASDASISKALKILEKEGFIKKKSSHGLHGSNSYYLPKLQLMKNRTSTNEDPNFNKRTPKLHSMKSYSSINEDEVYPYNYNHLTISHLTKEKERKHIPFKEREEWEKKIKEVVGEIINREITPLEERLLEEILLYTPGEELLGALEDFYLHNPKLFKEQGLFILEGESGS